MFKKLIEKKLGGYLQQLNHIDTSLDLRIPATKTVAIIGAGLAGISAAAYLAPRGFKVDVYEKDSFIGGKMAIKLMLSMVFMDFLLNIIISED